MKGKRVKSVSVFISALNSGCDFALLANSSEHAMSNAIAGGFTVREMYRAVKSGRLYLAKNRKKKEGEI